MMYEAFCRWCKHHNKELSSAGYAAMNAFLKQVLLKRLAIKERMMHVYKV